MCFPFSRKRSTLNSSLTRMEANSALADTQQSGSNVFESCSSNANKPERLFITQIRANGVVPSLRGSPRGFYVSVEIDGTITETLNKPTSMGKDEVEWNEVILLPSKRSSVISLNVYASFELGPRLGKGELLGLLRISVGEVLDRGEQSQPVSFPISREGEGSVSSHWSLGISTERRLYNMDEYAMARNQMGSDMTSEMAQLTDMGHFLLCHVKNRNRNDVDEALACFERALEMCPPAHSNRATALFNLATAKVILCQTNNTNVNLDVPIALYRDALLLRRPEHPDHCATALRLAFALLSRFQGQHNEADKMEARSLLSGIIQLYPEKCGSLAVFCALELAEMSVEMMGPGISHIKGGCYNGMVLQGARGILENLPDSDPERAALLAARFVARLLSISRSEVAMETTPDEHSKTLAWLDLPGSPSLDHFGGFGDLADTNKTILMHEEAVRLTPSDQPDKPGRLGNLTKLVPSCSDRIGNIEDISKSTPMHYLTPSGHPDKPTRLSNLANSLSRRFDRLGDITDINESISMHAEALRLTPSSHPDKPARLGNLANSLSRRFTQTGDIADIDRAISMHEEAVSLTPSSHPNKPARLGNLAISLYSRFYRLGDIADINKSISMHEKALRLTPNSHPNKQVGLSNLANSLSSRFDRFGDIIDINESISLHEKALRLTPSSHPNKPAHLGNLANSLYSRFDRLGDTADINKSISMHEEALRLTPNSHPDKPTRLGNLATSLSSRFDRLGDIADINKSISMHEEALRLTPDTSPPDKPARLSNLANPLSSHFDHLDDIADINKSISMHEALRLTPSSPPDRLTQLGNLAASLSRRFDHLGDIADINKSISMLEEAVRLTPSSHPDKPARLSNLANPLSRRFDHLGDIADIDKSISTLEEAVRLTPSSHPDKPARLSNLANPLSRRFDHLGDIADIDKSISMHEDALRLTPSSHPNKPPRLSNLANSLSSRFDHLGDIADINKSISMHEEALRLTPGGHPDKPARLCNLANSLSRRFYHLHDTADVNNAISILKEAIRLIPNGHFNKPCLLSDFGSVLMTYFQRVNDQSSLTAAIDHLSAAATSSTGPTSERFHAACRWMTCVRLTGNPKSLLGPYATIITLLPQLAWLGLPLTERHRVLLNAADIARDAAAAAVDADQPQMAVEWLEQGRSIVWNQLLNLRAPVDDLRVCHPILAEQYQQTSHELEDISSRRTTNIEYPQLNVLDSAESSSSLEKETQRHHELALKRDRLLEEIRSLPGFERFLLPKTIEQLSSFAHSGPIVYLNASEQRCDALIVKADSYGVIPAALPDVTYHDLEFLNRLQFQGQRSPTILRNNVSARISSVNDFPSRHLLSIVLKRGRSDERPGELAETEGCSPEDWLEGILEYLWRSVVNPVLKALGISAPSSAETMPQIFWCLTGPFAFMPIHAAGLYDVANSDPGNKLSDFAISSYIPTLSCLAPSAQMSVSNDPRSCTRIVAVPQPPTDGQMKLHFVNEEFDHIKQLSYTSPYVTLQHSDGTIEDVMEKMKTSDWVHFACHGVQDRERPLDSGLCLADGRRLKLSDIIRLSRPQGGLAFLSACQTARGDEDLPEESVHLAAGMLLAGYNGIIATMWSIKDRDAPRVAGDVYKHLFRDGKVPDPTEAAKALHHAVQRLRDSGAPFSSWVPFIHIGR